MTVKEVSQGTLRGLGILAALHQRVEPLGTDPTLVMIDEIEDSIHPHALEALVEAAELSTERFPIVLTTHSPEVLGLKQVDVDGVRIVQWKDGTSRIYALGEATKAGIDRINTVGELLRYNALWPSDTPEAFMSEFLEA